MQRFAVTVHRATPTGAVVADLTRYATRCRWSFNRHGAADLEVTAPRRFVEAMRLYQMSGLLWLVASQGARRVWVGRLAAPELWAGDDGSGITLRALGRWAALGDLPYTALWSTTQVGEWEPLLEEQNAHYTPDRYTLDTNNRLYISPEKNVTVGNTGLEKRGALWFGIPHRSSRKITNFSASYSLTPGNPWTLDVTGYTIDYTTTPYTFGFVSSPFSTNTAGSGSISASFGTPVDVVAVSLRYAAADGVTVAEAGTFYAKLTNIRVKTTTASEVNADAIVSDIASQVSALNPSLISATTLAQNPGYDFTDLILEDADPRDVLNAVAEKGDGAGTVYDVGVDLDGHLFLHPAGTNAREWLIDVADISVVSERETLANSVYAVYEDASGRPLRTAASANAASVGLAGYARRVAVGVRTTSATRAGEWRDQALADGATVRPSGRYRLRRVLTAYGALADPSEVRPGDTLTVRNLPLAAGAGGEVDRVRTFRLSETAFDPIARELDVTPEQPQPRLEVLIAQGAI